MEKIIFENAMLELVKDTLDMAKPEHALLSAIMEFQTTSIEDLQQAGVQETVKDLTMLRERIKQFGKALEDYKANDGDTEDNAVCEVVEALNDSLAADTVLGNAIELLGSSTDVEQLRSAKGRETVADLANVCSAFVRLRDAIEHYFDSTLEAIEHFADGVGDEE